MFIISKDGVLEIRLGDGKTGLVTGTVKIKGKTRPSIAMYPLEPAREPGTRIGKEDINLEAGPSVLLTFENPKGLGALLAMVANAGLKFKAKAKKKVVKKKLNKK